MDVTDGVSIQAAVHDIIDHFGRIDVLVNKAGIMVDSTCPGWVKTDMGGPQAPLTPARGADTPIWLATLPDNGPTGGFFRERELIPW